MKPYKLTERLVLLHTRPGVTVLDLFCGNGNAAIVCKRLDRKYIGIDNNKEYLDEAIERIERG
jgi:DNA modification methylase